MLRQKRSLQLGTHLRWFWSGFCVATSGVMRFSVCSSLGATHFFVSRKVKKEKEEWKMETSSRKIGRKKIISFLLVSIILLLSVACSSKQSITDISADSTKEEIDSMIKGGNFLGLSGVSVKYWMKEDGHLKLLNCSGLYVDSNKEIVDKMLVELSSKYGQPKTTTEKSTRVYHEWKQKGIKFEIYEKGREFYISFDYR